MITKNIFCRNYLYAIWVALTISGWAQLTDGPKVEVKLKLIDEAGKPVPEAKAIFSFIGVINGMGETFRTVSGADGNIKAKSSLNGHVRIEISKQGYYSVVWPQVISKGSWDGADIFQSTVILREIKEPIALYAKTVELSVPKYGEWIGYDFQKGDWIAPFGKGAASDIEFLLTRNFDGFIGNIAEKIDHLESLHDANPRLRKSYLQTVAEFHHVQPKEISFEDAKKHQMGKWSGELKLRVPSERGGIVTVKKGYQAFALASLASHYYGYENWEMRLPHSAPEEGYLPTPLLWNGSYPFTSPPVIDAKAGYFLRTRVLLDSVGKIVSANYAKIMTSDAKYNGSDIHFDPRGKIYFTYYFNPTSNDQNLEFDPKKNLFTDLVDIEKVLLP